MANFKYVIRRKNKCNNKINNIINHHWFLYCTNKRANNFKERLKNLNDNSIHVRDKENKIICSYTIEDFTFKKKDGSSVIIQNEYMKEISGKLITIQDKLLSMNKENYKQPTKDNPFMNILIPEIKYDPKRKPAAPTFNPIVEKEINETVKDVITEKFNDKNIKEKLFGGLGEELTFNRSMIPFTANANTTIPNDQDGFANWLYGPLNSCRDGNKQRCVDNISNRHILR